MKVECYGCGRDCSHSYGTYNGYPYHFGCLPEKRPKRKYRAIQIHPSPSDRDDSNYETIDDRP